MKTIVETERVHLFVGRYDHALVRAEIRRDYHSITISLCVAACEIGIEVVRKHMRLDLAKRSWCFEIAKSGSASVLTERRKTGTDAENCERRMTWR